MKKKLIDDLKDYSTSRVLPFMDFQTCFSSIGSISDFEDERFEIEKFFEIILNRYSNFDQPTILRKEVPEEHDLKSRQIFDLVAQKEGYLPGVGYSLSFIHTEAGLATPPLNYQFIFLTGLLFRFWLNYTKLDPVLKYPKKIFSSVTKYDEHIKGIRFLDTVKEQDFKVFKNYKVTEPYNDPLGCDITCFFLNSSTSYVETPVVNSFEVKLPVFKSDFLSDTRWYRANTMFTFPVMHLVDSFSGIKTWSNFNSPDDFRNRNDLFDEFTGEKVITRKEVPRTVVTPFADHRFKVLYPYYKDLSDHYKNHNLFLGIDFSESFLNDSNQFKVEESLYLEQLVKYYKLINLSGDYGFPNYFNLDEDKQDSKIYKNVAYNLNLVKKGYFGFSEWISFDYLLFSSIRFSSESTEVNYINHLTVARASKLKNLYPLFKKIEKELFLNASSRLEEVFLKHRSYIEAVFVFKPKEMPEKPKNFSGFYFRDRLLRFLYSNPHVKMLSELYGLSFNEYLILSLSSIYFSEIESESINCLFGTSIDLRLDWLNLDTDEYESLAQFFDMIIYEEDLIVQNCFSDEDYKDALLASSFTFRSPVVDSLLNIENRFNIEHLTLENNTRFPDLVKIHKHNLSKLKLWPSILRAMGIWQKKYDRSVNSFTADRWFKAGYLDQKFQVSAEDKLGNE